MLDKFDRMTVYLDDRHKLEVEWLGTVVDGMTLILSVDAKQLHPHAFKPDSDLVEWRSCDRSPFVVSLFNPVNEVEVQTACLVETARHCPEFIVSVLMSAIELSSDAPPF